MSEVQILPGSPSLLGYSLVWSKATVFEIVITGSNPVTSANNLFPRSSMAEQSADNAETQVRFLSWEPQNLFRRIRVL